MSRTTAAALTLLAVALGLSACTSAPEKPDDGEPPLGQIPVSVDVKTLALPLDGYLATQKQQLTMRQAQNRLMSDCLSRFGFDITPPTQRDPLPFGRHERLFGVVDEKRAEIYGYRTPEVGAQPKPKEPELTPEASAVISGTGQNMVGGKEVPEGGCLGESKRKLAEGAPAVSQPDLAKDLSSDAHRRATEDSRVSASFAKWSECMAKVGYHYQNPSDAINDPVFASNNAEKAGDQEIATAVADVRCKKEVNLVGIWSAAEIAYQNRALDRNREQLDAVKSLLETNLRNAATIAGN